jgi:hypothetical protein
MFKSIIGKYKSRKFEATLKKMEQQQEVEQAAQALKQRIDRLMAQKSVQKAGPQIAA